MAALRTLDRMADLTDRLSATLRTITDRRRDPDRTAPDWALVGLHGSYPDQAGLGLRGMLGGIESIQSLRDKLARLRDSDRITHVLVRVGDLSVGSATLDTLASMVADLAATTRVVAYLPRVSAGTLLLSRAAHEIVAPPSAEVRLTGLALEQTYYGAFLRDHGIAWEVERIGRYKSAVSRFTDDHMDDAQREQLQAYLDSAQQHWVSKVAESRGTDTATVAGWLEADPINADQAAALGALTRVAYEDEIVRIDPAERTAALEYVLPRLSATARSSRLLHHGTTPDRVALVRVDGMITTSVSRPATPFRPQLSGSDTVVAQLRAAKADKHTRAIVLAVDSGGGSAVASDLIGREVATSQVPVVAVMGNVAASGGYYVAAPAREILANPFTLTGSIGVILGRPVIRELMERHGIHTDRLGDERSLTFSLNREWSEEDREFLRRQVDDIYARFVKVVAAGRGKTYAEIDALGQGRIWSGADARQAGLIDGYGDVKAATVRARELAGLAEDAPVWRPSVRGTHGPFAAVPELGRGVRDWLEPFGDERVLTAVGPGLRLRW